MRTLIAVFASFFVISFVIVVGPFMLIIDWSDPPSDKTMIDNFMKERTSFEKLVRAAWLSAEVLDLDDRSISADVHSLMGTTGVRQVRHDRKTGETVFLYDSAWFAGDGWAKMYVHAPGWSSYWRAVPDLDEAYASQALKPLMVERAIADGWAIRLDYSP